MQLEVRKTKKLLPVFSDIHGEQNGNKLAIEVTFAIDPNIEALAAAFYMDGSGSMQEAGNYGRQGLFGLGRQRNLVEEAMRVIIPYISHKDTNSKCYVAYWSTGEQGKNIEPIGELSSEAAGITSFVGPTAYGNETRLLPAVRDFVAYIQRLLKQGETVQAALAVIVTDGKFHDFTDVRDYTKSQLVPAIVAGKFPKTVFSVVGVGKDVDPEQMEELMHEATPYGHLPQPAESISRLVGATPQELMLLREGLQIATITEPGSLIGEMSVLLGDDHSATVRATTPVEVRVIENAIAFLESTPLVALQVATLVCQRLEATSALLVDIKKEAAAGKSEQVA